ncbi:hypothetical protein BDK51DRAFT_51459 [Blyttiomyces helicus]|uniref:Uncharacterized protein n=1 Tax=Blyttiomyces helicus TaxID=388810 RepID=A0A4P9WC49_9FUNG|nr:hypothetical protein BDK51DRAFT_51459 [Blyttiomyces helicus]|eukprot:RKO89163.1 hypothetical protein BDK51DRAFT_51459 [Blyttiomyces helicus]
MVKSVVKLMLTKLRSQGRQGNKEYKEDKAGPLWEALTGATVLAAAGKNTEDDEHEDEQEDEQDLEEAIEEASGEEADTEYNYSEDYFDGSSSVVTVKKVKAKTVPKTLGKLLWDHAQRLGAGCGDLVLLNEGGPPYEPFDRDAEASLLSKDGEVRIDTPFCLALLACAAYLEVPLSPPPPQLPPPPEFRSFTSPAKVQKGMRASALSVSRTKPN